MSAYDRMPKVIRDMLKELPINPQDLPLPLMQAVIVGRISGNELVRLIKEEIENNA